MNTKFRVETGDERWDYDSEVPTRDTVDYWVMFGSEFVRKFIDREDAVKYANKLNEYLKQIK